MSFRVAFDLDGTIADMQAVLKTEAERLFGGPRPEAPAAADLAATAEDEPSSAPAPVDRELTSRQHADLWNHVTAMENFWLGLPEIEPGIVARIFETSLARGWEVIFLTTRPPTEGDPVERQSKQWLVQHGFPLPSVFVVHRSRGKIADALDLDAFVDDRAENSLDVALDSKAVAVLIWPRGQEAAPPGAVRLGVRLVASIGDALDLLVKLDDAKNGRGVVRSLRKLFGKETTA